jgi:hypothetical protein
MEYPKPLDQMTQQDWAKFDVERERRNQRLWNRWMGWTIAIGVLGGTLTFLLGI